MTQHSLALRTVVALIAVSAPNLSLAQGNTLTFDWSTRPSTVGQSVNAPPISIPSTRQFTIKITNVNDLLYHYGLDCTATEKAGPDLSPLVKLIGAGGGLGLESASCPNASKLIKTIADYFSAPGVCGNNCSSVALADTESMVDGFLKQAKDLGCKPEADVQAQLDQQIQKLTAFQKETTHDILFTAPISPDATYVCRVTESYNTKPTTNGTLAISINPTNNVLTLSLGVLFSGIQNRSYSSASVPNSSGTGTSNVLSVQGNSFSSSIAAFANFRLPIRALQGESWGLDATAGPTYRLDSKGSASSVGFFTGVSLRLYKYLFITPGVHVGSFADFPQGFSSAGQPIPPGFPTPVPRTRNTAKFGVAVSFQTKDFGSLGKTTATTTPAPSVGAGGGAQPQAAGAQPQAPGAQPQAPGTQPQAPGAQPQAAGAQPQAAGGVQIQTNNGVSWPTAVDFGIVTTSPVVKQILFSNTTSDPVKLQLDVQSAPTELNTAGLTSCSSIQPHQQCMAVLTLKPGAQTGQTTLNVVLNSLPTDLPITLTWRSK